MNRVTQEFANDFLIKRAFRYGVATRHDLLQVLSISQATATRVLGATVAKFSALVHYGHDGIRPRPLAVPPPFASESALLENLSGGNKPLTTGLFDQELPVVIVQWTQSLPAKPGSLMKIVRAITQDRIICITYIGLRHQEEPRERRILPLALERMNDQWRVIAQDIAKDNHPIRAFALARILDVSLDRSRRPRHFTHQGHQDGYSLVPVHFNPKLNTHQRAVLGRELNVVFTDPDSPRANETPTMGHVKVLTRSLYEFRRRFLEQNPQSSDVIWPIFLPDED